MFVHIWQMTACRDRRCTNKKQAQRKCMFALRYGTHRKLHALAHCTLILHLRSAFARQLQCDYSAQNKINGAITIYYSCYCYYTNLYYQGDTLINDFTITSTTIRHRSFITHHSLFIIRRNSFIIHHT